MRSSGRERRWRLRLKHHGLLRLLHGRLPLLHAWLLLLHGRLLLQLDAWQRLLVSLSL